MEIEVVGKLTKLTDEQRRELRREKQLESNRRWRKKNLRTARACSRAYRQKNIEKLRAYARAYRQKLKLVGKSTPRKRYRRSVKYKEYQHSYYLRNREKIRLQEKARRQKPAAKERRAARQKVYNRKYYQEHRVKMLEKGRIYRLAHGQKPRVQESKGKHESSK